MTEEQKTEDVLDEKPTAVPEHEGEDDEYEYQPPVTGQEFRETVSDAAEYVKDAWLQPARRWIRGGFDAVEDFTRDLSGKNRKKRD